MSDPGFRGLDPCVHCGFCLPACPTYAVTADEADSPRGRIVLMRALERGQVDAGDPGLAAHLDTCLGCRACEPACPSGVSYGAGLEAARARMTDHRGLPLLGRTLLATMASTPLRQVVLGGGRALRGTGVAGGLAGPGRMGSALGMLAATRPARVVRADVPQPTGGPVVGLFRGCVMQGLFAHVHAAMARVLRVNGYRVVELPGATCCGALHAHAGDAAGARRLAERNSAALAGVDLVALDSAGCGAMLKEYAHHAGSAGEGVAGKVRDVSELLAGRELRRGGALDLVVAYDAPCHLQHAQGVHDAVLAMLDAVPGLRRMAWPGSDRCCGSAGIFSMLEPGMSQAVLEAKVAGLAALDPRPALVVTGNPGCLMQIGAGLRANGLPIGVAHPVELLDWSYEEGGVYG